MGWSHKHPADLTATEKRLKRGLPYLILGLIGVTLVVVLIMLVSFALST